jgi:sugar phosphate isomerase/epimerase
MSEQRRLSRRGFVGASAGAAAAATLGAPPALGHGDRGRGGRGRLLPRGNIGIQLFTIRDQVATLGFEEVFRRLSEIGYREIEFAGYNAQGRRWSNEELRRLLRRYGLRGIGSHIGYTQFLNNLEQVLNDAEEIGLPYVGTANSPGAVHGETVAGYQRAAEDFNRFGAAARARGIRFYQHNHSGEFALENGTRLYDVILEETDPRLVFFELDIFWAYVGQSRFPGFEPHEYPWFMPERFPLFHVKDGLDFSNADATVPRPPGPSSFEWFMTDVGDGDVAFEPFFAGLDRDDHHYIVERDTAPDSVANPAGSFSTAERSYDYLASLRARN